MAGPVYPNVPVTLGVPAVRRDASNPGTSSVSQLSSDGSAITQMASTQWGIYRGTSLALKPDNIVAVSYDAEYRIADYPIEEGGFESYDNVALPFEATVRLTKGGRRADREAFIKAAEAMRSDTELYSIVTPEVTYRNVNVSRITIDRSQENGAGMITVDMHLREIRQNAKVEFSAVKDPASANPYSNGSTQAQSAPANPGAVQ